MNEYDSNRIFDSEKKIGYEKTYKYEEANCYLLNTCHIRDKAKEKVYHEIGRVKKIFRSKIKPLVIVAGCVAAFVFNKVDHCLLAEAALITWLFERTVRAVLGNRGAGSVADARALSAGAAGIILLGRGVSANIGLVEKMRNRVTTVPLLANLEIFAKRFVPCLGNFPKNCKNIIFRSFGVLRKYHLLRIRDK